MGDEVNETIFLIAITISLHPIIKITIIQC